VFTTASKNNLMPLIADYDEFGNNIYILTPNLCYFLIPHQLDINKTNYKLYIEHRFKNMIECHYKSKLKINKSYEQF